MGINEKNRQITITGIIVSSDFDKRGNVIEVAIETETFGRYIVADNNKGQELLNLIDKEVRAIGSISGEDIYGNSIIVISKYDLVRQTYFQKN